MELQLSCGGPLASVLAQALPHKVSAGFRELHKIWFGVLDGLLHGLFVLLHSHKFSCVLGMIDRTSEHFPRVKMKRTCDAHYPAVYDKYPHGTIHKAV